MHIKNDLGGLCFVSRPQCALALAATMLLVAMTGFAQRGATVPWTTYEAENMTISGGTILGPRYLPNLVESESSGRECVQLSSTNSYIQFAAQAPANALVVRYSVPDIAGGGGTNYTLSLYTNGTLAAELPVTSVYSWLYGSYGNGQPAWTQTPSSGSPRNFYDEVRLNGLAIKAGDTIRLEKGTNDTAVFYDIDLVDLENVAAPLAQPANSVPITLFGADNTGNADSTAALQDCVAYADSMNESVWMPAGTYKISALIDLTTNTTIQGAGMWYTTLVGDPTVYNTTPSARITFNGDGSNIHLSDFAIVGKLNYRNDGEPNDGLGGAYGTGSTLTRLWVEHVKTGAWILNSQGLVIDGCRFRDTIADGCNLNSGMQGTLVTNCTARGTGDDCFAIWPASSGSYPPGSNIFTHCTGEVPFLANGGSIYGGVNNQIEECLFQDITYGCGVLCSTTFGGVLFSGTTVAQDCDLIRCGGFDPGYGWRAALQMCLDGGYAISGVNLLNLNITNSISDGLSVIGGSGPLADAFATNVNITGYGLGVGGRNALWARSDALGSLTVNDATVPENLNDSTAFTFNFGTNAVNATIGTSPSGLAFTVDGNAYASQETFGWVPGSPHTLATTGVQNSGGGEYTWSSWSDGGALSHNVSPASNATYTASFAFNPGTVYVATNGLVLNGGFETGDLTDWTVAGGEFVVDFSFVTGAGVPYVHSGDYGAALGQSGSIGTLSQTLSTVPGQRYLLSFWLENPISLATEIFAVDWNGNELYAVTNPPVFVWTNFNLVVTAPGASTTLQFAAENDPDFFGLDDISVVSAQPGVGSFSRSGANLVINGTNGISGGTYYVLTSTNLGLPPAQWTPVVTNILGAYGNFAISLTNALISKVPGRFYRLQMQ